MEEEFITGKENPNWREDFGIPEGYVITTHNNKTYLLPIEVNINGLKLTLERPVTTKWTNLGTDNHIFTLLKGIVLPEPNNGKYQAKTILYSENMGVPIRLLDKDENLLWLNTGDYEFLKDYLDKKILKMWWVAGSCTPSPEQKLREISTVDGYELNIIYTDNKEY